MCMEKLVKNLSMFILCACAILRAQNIDISNFYYRDYLDFGQNKGIFKEGGLELSAKDGKKIKFPNAPDFSASSNNGSLTSIGRGFVATANHVESAENPDANNNIRKFGLTTYNIAKEEIGEVNGISKPYGSDTKFLRFNKFIVEGQTQLLDTQNTTKKEDENTTKERENLADFKNKLSDFKDNEGNIYIYQTGLGIITLKGSTETKLNRIETGETRGGGFGKLGEASAGYGCLVQSKNCPTRGIVFNYYPDLDFNNRITRGDSGSGFYAYNTKSKKWMLIGVTSMEWNGQNRAHVAHVSNKDFEDYRKNFEQNINLNGQNLTFQKPQGTFGQIGNTSLQANKNIIFSGGGNIEVKQDIDRMQSAYAGGFVFDNASSPTTYKFTNEAGKNHFFSGSGLDIGENVTVEWALRNKSGESLHKIGKGELIVKTNYLPNLGENSGYLKPNEEKVKDENLGYLKLGEGKVKLDTDKKAFEGVYITSGRGKVELVNGKATALGATKDASGTNSFTLAQNSTKEMGFYFGTNGGVLDLMGNSLHLNTIAANDSKAILTNSHTTRTNLQIDGFGYTNEKKTNAKADTIIHASIGETNTNDTNSGANLNIISKNDTKTDKSLVFDGHINIKGKLEAHNSNIVLQAHPAAHAIISKEDIRNKIITAEQNTTKAMPEYMDLTRPSTLHQPDWDRRNFAIKDGIKLTSSTLTIGKGANVTADITADNSSQIDFGGKHFIDEKDTTNVRGSGFDYYQLIQNGDLKDDEMYKDSSYSGKITANGTKINSKFINFAPNLELSGGNLNAKYLTFDTKNSINLKSNSTAKVENLVIKEISTLNNKFTLDNTSKFEVQKGIIFDKSTFDLQNLKNLGTNSLTLAQNYNLAVLNSSVVSANDYSNNTDAEILVQDSTLKANKMDFTKNAKIILNKGTLNLENALTSKNLSLNLANSSKFSAKTLSASGELNLNADENSNITLDTLSLNSVANANISKNTTIKALNLDQSSVHFDKLSSASNINLTNNSALHLNEFNQNNIINLQNNSNVYLNEINLNTNGANLTSDENSLAHIKKLTFDANNGANLAKSNIVVSENFTLNNVGKNLGQNANNEALKKDLLAFELSKNLTLDGANLDINFADIIKKDNEKLQFNKFYEVFGAKKLSANNINIKLNLKNNKNFYAKGKLDSENNKFFVEFVKENPRNFNELSPHTKNKSNLALLEILLQHNKNDKSIDKAINEDKYDELNAKLEKISKDFKTLAKSNESALTIVPLIQKQQINLRIEQNRFTTQKFATANNVQSDVAPNFILIDEPNRVFTNVAASYFSNKNDKFTLQSASIGYDKKLFDDDFLLGIMASLSQGQFSSEQTTFKPKIYTFSMYSNAIFNAGELQNELSFSALSGNKSFQNDTGEHKGTNLSFETLYKADLSSISKNIKPLVLVRVNSNSMQDFSTQNYKQKGANDISIDLGLGAQWLWQKENGFYSLNFIAERDVFHTQKSVDVSLKKASKFISYKTNEPKFDFNLHAFGFENFSNGIFLQYGVSAFIDTNSYKGVKGDLQIGYKF